MHKKQTPQIKKTFLILQCSALKSTVELYNSWLTGPGIRWTGKKSDSVENGEKVEDGRDERLSAIGGIGQAAISLMPDTDGRGSGSLLHWILLTLLKKRSSDVWVPAC